MKIKKSTTQSVFLALFCIFFMINRATAAPLPNPRGTVELHAHLFMKEGMTWAFRGDFFGPLKAKDWNDKLSSQANPESVNRSDISILVATLYAHPLFTLSMRDSIRRQIALAEKFVAENPQWIIARSPAQARSAIAEGKRVIVLAIEGAAGIIENEDDLKEFVDEKGVRIITLLHLMDDHYGGVAFLKGVEALSTPWAWIKNLGSPHRSEGVRVNPNGLTEEGRQMTLQLIKRHVWVDLSHASDPSTHELITIYREKNLPLLYTHTALRKYLGAERGISEWEIQAVRESGGFVGLMPCEKMLQDTKTPGACPNGIHALAQQYSELSAVLGSASVALGSDYNGSIDHLRPSACPVGTSLDSEGLWNIGQTPVLWDSLEKMGAPVPNPRAQMVEKFLQSWDRIMPSSG